MHNFRFSAVIEKDEDGYTAFCPELSGRYSIVQTLLRISVSIVTYAKELYGANINRILITMSSSSGSVEDKIRMLPPDLREEAIHYIDELLRRSKKTSPAPFRCAAEGTLAELGTRYSSVDLQHKALEWRGA